MSVKELYCALGVEGYDVVEVWEQDGELCVLVEAPRESLRCPDCRSQKVHIHERHPRMWRSAPIGNKPVTIHMDVLRVKCQECGAARRIEVSFAGPLVRYTKSFEQFAAQLLKVVTPADLARHLGISWGTAAAIDQRRLKRLPRPKLKQLRHLAIDEIYSGKLHKYLTLVLDLDSGAVVFVGHGRGEAALRPFFQQLKRGRAKIEAVAMDMAGGYIKAMKKHRPDTVLVFDRFHVVKLMNEKLTKLRRELHREATDKLHRKVLKGTRWLLLMGQETLDTRPHRRHSGPTDRERLQAALDLNRPLATAYYLKEDLRLFWAQGSKKRAEAFLDDWCRRAEASGIAVLKTMANTLRTHRSGLLAWYDVPISTGPLEGTNNKIKIIQRRAYGYRNQDHFILRILTLHHTKHTLVG